MELLKQLGKVFNKIAEKNSQEGANKQPKNNGIKTYNKEPQPRVAVPQTKGGKHRSGTRNRATVDCRMSVGSSC